MNTRLLLLLCIMASFFYGCTDSIVELEAVFGDFTLDLDRKIAVFDGTIDSEAEADLSEMLGFYNTVEEIRFENATGASSASSAFAMAELISANNLTTSIVENGEISQFATYVFLGGTSRSLGDNAKIGVNSWQTNNGIEASTLSEDNNVHDPFISFLMNNGYSEDDAQEFYFFTLNAASSSEVHYLSKEEINNFRLIN